MSTRSLSFAGFTLPELLVTLFILGILTNVAIPSFINSIVNNRMASISNRLVTALAYAKSEAIKRGIQVSIKPKDNSPGVWENGWDVFADINANGAMENTDELLKTYEALPEGYSLRTGANFATWMAYMANGISRGSYGFANDTFSLCDRDRDNSRSRAIIIKMGRPRTETGSVKCS